MVQQADNIDIVLDTCLERMAGGETIAACLQDYPQYAAELAPLLETADDLRQWAPPQLSPAAYTAARARAHAAFAQHTARSSTRSRRGWWPVLFPSLPRVAIALAVLCALLGGTVAAAQASGPGSPLYPVKRGSEAIRLAVATRPAKRLDLQLAFAERRINEAVALAAAGHPLDDASLRALADAYDAAGQLFARLPEREQAARQAHYARELAAQQDKLTALGKVAGTMTNRLVLADAARANNAAQAQLMGPPARVPPLPATTPPDDRPTAVPATGATALTSPTTAQPEGLPAAAPPVQAPNEPEGPPQGPNAPLASAQPSQPLQPQPTTLPPARVRATPMPTHTPTPVDVQRDPTMPIEPTQIQLSPTPTRTRTPVNRRVEPTGEPEPTKESRRPEEPKATRTPKATEAPKGEQPKATKTPKPTREPKALEESKAEQPKPEEPRAEEPKATKTSKPEDKAEQPKPEEPRAEEPKATKTSKTEDKAEQPKPEEPRAEEPKATKTSKPEDKAEQPKATKTPKPTREPKALEESKAEEPRATREPKP